MRVKGGANPDLDAYLPALRAMPHVKTATIRDRELLLRTDVGAFELMLETRQQPLNRAGLNQVLDLDWGRGDRLVLIPYVPPNLARELAAQGVNFLDLAGNCHLVIGHRYVAHIEGRKQPPRERRGRGLGAAGYRVLFALLARPQLLNEPIRTIAATAGVAKTGVAHLLERLEGDGTLARATKGRTLAQPERLLERWINGYADQLRPKLVLGRFRAPDNNPARLEAQIEDALAGERWAWGGGAAAQRLTKHYRGEATLVHLAHPVPRLPQLLRALPDKNGPLTLALAPGPLAFEGPLPNVVHPLLAYTELLALGGEREREAAGEIRERYLAQ